MKVSLELEILVRMKKNVSSLLAKTTTAAKKSSKNGIKIDLITINSLLFIYKYICYY
jgi:hypothetical protein